MKLCRHPHIVRLLEVIDDKLYQKVYMGQLVSLCPPPRSIDRTYDSNGISRGWRNQMA